MVLLLSGELVKAHELVNLVSYLAERILDVEDGTGGEVLGGEGSDFGSVLC